MSGFLENFHFIRPWWLMLLLPVLLTLFWKRKSLMRTPSWRDLCDEKFLPFLGVSESQSRHFPVDRIIIVICLVIAILALAGPSWHKLPQPVFKAEQARVFVLDMSLSMMASDVKPNRLSRARLKLIDMLSRSKEGQSALIVYADRPYVVSPLTDDAHTIAAMVPALSVDLMPVQGNNTDAAIAKAVNLLEQSNVSSGSIYLIADDVSNNATEVAAMAAGRNYQVHVYAVGTEEGAPVTTDDGQLIKDRQGAIVIPRLDVESMRDLALAGEGNFVRMSVNESDLDSLLSAETVADVRVSEEENQRITDLWQEEGPWLVLLLLPLVAIGFRKGGFLAISVVFLCIPSPPAMAFEWESLWLNDNQRAHKMLQEKNFEAASNTFSDPSWKGAAQYRSGNYKDAVSSFSGDSISDLYNRGNALAKSGSLEEALKQYEKVLQNNPEHADARFNRDLVKNLLESQEQQNEQQQNDQQNESENQKDQDSQQNASNQKDNEQSETGDEQQSPSDQESQQQQSAGQKESDKNKADQEAGQEQPEQKDEREQLAEQQKKEASDDVSDDRNAQAALSENYKEEQQAMEQWLRRIPDDPGGLLRQKFLLQHRLQEAQRADQ